MSGAPVIFDRALHARRLDRAAAHFERADFLERRAAEDLVERLEVVNRRFDLALELGARGGSLPAALAASPAAAKVGGLVRCGLSPAMLARTPGLRVVGDEERLPFGPATFDLVVSCLSLHWVNDLVGALIQVRRCLKPDGLFLGAMLGGATLSELRACLLEAEVRVRGGAGPRVSPFADITDAGALLQRAGFALPVVDTDQVRVRYDHPLALLADLRAMGETSVLVDRPATPLTRAVLFHAFDLYAERHALPDGRIEATFEILTITGWAPHPDQPKPLRPGSAKMRLADALHVRDQRAEDGQKI